jgi:hypothetical protein
MPDAHRAATVTVPDRAGERDLPGTGAAGVDDTSRGELMATFRMVYGDGEQVVRETFSDVELEREDGWTVLFRGSHAILGVHDEHVQSLERIADVPQDDPVR